MLFVKGISPILILDAQFHIWVNFTFFFIELFFLYTFLCILDNTKLKAQDMKRLINQKDHKITRDRVKL